MRNVLVTGGAGQLGRLTVEQLRAAGDATRGMSRRANPGTDWPGAAWTQADLETGAGLAEATQGVETVVHTASGGNRHSRQIDVEGTCRLLDAARASGVAHVVYVSIVGIDRVPYAYGASKLAAENLIRQSGIPWSILRATQFHCAVDAVLRFMTRLPPVALLPVDFLLQPVAEGDVARRLVQIVQLGPTYRLEDMGGPEIHTSGALARIWLKQRRLRRAIIPFWLPGKTAGALRRGGNTCPNEATGIETWEAWLQRHERQ
jgi:uncharacterized protein YbjT (DUF2867 family)